MPLPSPAVDESEDTFVSRCMADDAMNAEYPDEAQRAAVCHRQFGGDSGDKALTHKNLTCSIKAASDGPDVYVATISTDTVDLDGEVMVPAGMDAKDFEKRGTVFWNHDYGRPIAKAVGKLKREDRRIVSRFKFAERPANAVGEWFPDTVRALVDQDIIRGVSIGFRSVEARPATKGDRRAYGDGCARVHSQWKLGEYSIAPFQCNPDATIEAVRKGVLSQDVADRLLSVKVPAASEPATVVKAVKHVRLVVMMADGTTSACCQDISRMVNKAVAKAIGLLYI